VAATRLNNLFVARLRALTSLGEVELTALDTLCSDRRHYRARSELVVDGSHPERVHVLLEGCACRYKLLSDGRRQITALLIPGDLCDIDALHVWRGDFAVATLTPATVAPISRPQLRRLAAEHARIADALGWLGAVENAMLAERNACLGRRSAREHVAHLICELFVRLAVIGRVEGDSYSLPITQEEIADVLGLTSVHVNRVLQSLRSERLIEQQGGTLKVCDWQALRKAAGFRPDYLHLEGLDGAGVDGLGAAMPPFVRPAFVADRHV
jgi:CRP-like cAMP-binding protein